MENSNFRANTISLQDLLTEKILIKLLIIVAYFIGDGTYFKIHRILNNIFLNKKFANEYLNK